MKFKDEILRTIDETDNMIVILIRAIENGTIDKEEGLRRLRVILEKTRWVNSRISMN